MINSLSDKEAEALLFDWQMWARPEQILPEGNWPVCMALTGRGWGKTRTGAEWIRQRVQQGYKKIALIGQTKADVRDTMIELGESSILNICPPHERPKFIPSKRRLQFPNGAVATVFSGDEPDQLRGPQHDTVWIDELAKFKYPQKTWDNMLFGLRVGKSPQVFVSTTPRPLPIIRQLVNDPLNVIIRGTTYDNRDNLSPMFVANVLKKYEGTRIGRQELQGELLLDTPGALWTLALIEKHRVSKAPEGLKRIVVPIDPEATSTEGSSETGLVPVGTGSDGHYYVLHDFSLRGKPNVWGAKAILAYHDLQADLVIGEVNNGGEMIEAVIKNLDATVNYKAVRASRGKLTRAEPISALYEQGKVHHVGAFPELEDQMCTYVPGEKSPDRMDSLVWGITELSTGDKPTNWAAVVSGIEEALR